MKLKFWKRSQKKPYETGYDGPDAYRLPDEEPNFRGNTFTHRPTNSAGSFFVLKYFFGVFFLYATITGSLISWGMTNNEIVAGIGMVLFFFCGTIHCSWYAYKIDKFSTRN